MESFSPFLSWELLFDTHTSLLLLFYMVYTLDVQRCCAADATPLVSRPTPRADGGAVWADDKDDEEKWKAEVARRTQIQQEQLAGQAGA